MEKEAYPFPNSTTQVQVCPDLRYQPTFAANRMLFSQLTVFPRPHHLTMRHLFLGSPFDSHLFSLSIGKKVAGEGSSPFLVSLKGKPIPQNVPDCPAQHWAVSFPRLHCVSDKRIPDTVTTAGLPTGL